MYQHYTLLTDVLQSQMLSAEAIGIYHYRVANQDQPWAETGIRTYFLMSKAAYRGAVDELARHGLVRIAGIRLPNGGFGGFDIQLVDELLPQHLRANRAIAKEQCEEGTVYVEAGTGRLVCADSDMLLPALFGESTPPLETSHPVASGGSKKPTPPRSENATPVASGGTTSPTRTRARVLNLSDPSKIEDIRSDQEDKIVSHPTLPHQPLPTDQELGIEPTTIAAMLNTWQEESGNIWVANGPKYQTDFAAPFEEILRATPSLELAQAVLRDAISRMKESRDGNGKSYRVKSPAGLRSWTDDALARYTDSQIAEVPQPTTEAQAVDEPEITDHQLAVALAYRKKRMG